MKRVMQKYNSICSGLQVCDRVGIVFSDFTFTMNIVFLYNKKQHLIVLLMLCNHHRIFILILIETVYFIRIAIKAKLKKKSVKFQKYWLKVLLC